MKEYEFEQFREFFDVVEQTDDAGKYDEFFKFMCFCVERLKKDEPVQSIWSDYQNSVR